VSESIDRRSGNQFSRHFWFGLGLLTIGEALIVVRVRPASDFYFPFVWLGYILILDGATKRQTGFSLLLQHRRLWLSLFPVSAAFWWLFELFNQVVHNWLYVGAGRYTGLGFVAFASMDFSTVLPAVLTTALFMYSLFPAKPRASRDRPVPPAFVRVIFLLGIVSLALVLVAPRQTYGLTWVALLLVIDPINYWQRRPSSIGALAQGNWRLPVSLALGSLMCGIFWEGWNFWSLPKWIYDIPYVGFWHIFEMPALGWGGYLPFGLELFALSNLVLPRLGLGYITIERFLPHDVAQSGKLAS
jgi:hypothetical protein